jgi:hypothetical protein
MASIQSYTITLKNNTTEKEGIQYLIDRDRRFVIPDLDTKKEILKNLNQPVKNTKTFDLIYVNKNDFSFGDQIDLDSITLIELKTTRKKLESNPYGFFFGVTESEFDLARKLGDRYKFCFVCLHPECKSYRLLTLLELEKLIKNKRTQYQVNLMNETNVYQISNPKE